MSITKGGELLGKLVRAPQHITEYADVLGNQVGVVIEVYDHTQPSLLSILWANGEEESLYTDEVEFLKT